MMCTPWFTRTALCKRPSSANTRMVLSGDGGTLSTGPRPMAVPTRAQEEDVVGAVQALRAVDADLLVAQAALQQQWLAAHRAVHQEVVLDEVQHPVRHLEGRVDLQVPCVAGDALRTEDGVRLGHGRQSTRGCPTSYTWAGSKEALTVPGRGSGTGPVSVYHCCVSRFTSL